MTHRNPETTSKPGGCSALGKAWRTPTYRPCGVRCIGSVNLIWAFVRNLRTWLAMVREKVIRIRITRVNGQPEELAGPDGRRQPSMGGTSRVSREAQARICERLGVQSPGPTRQPQGQARLQPGSTTRLSAIGDCPGSHTGWISAGL